MKSANSLLLLALFGISTPVFAEWQRLPYSESVPVNLANRSVGGTSIQSSEGIGNPKALISANVSDTATLPSGKSEATIQLFGQHVLDEVRFVNDSGEGKVSVSTSIDGQKWQPVGQNVFASTGGSAVVKFAGAQARYVRVNFELAKGSTIRGFGIFGATTDKDYKIVEKETSSTSEGGGGSGGSSLNLAGGAGGARAIYAYPAPLNTNEDELKKNVFRFPKSKERFRVIVYDLGSPRQIKQFASAYSERPTRLEVFAFEKLPEKKDWRGKLTLDQTIFEKTKPVAVGEDARGVGHIKLVPEKPVTAQYVALRFEPNYNRHASASIEEESWRGGLAAAFLPFSSLVQQFGQMDMGRFVQAADGGGGDGGDVFDIVGIEMGASDFGNLKLELQALFGDNGPLTADQKSGKTDVADPSQFLSGGALSNLYSNHTAGGGAGSPNPFSALSSSLGSQGFNPTNLNQLKKLLATLQRTRVAPANNTAGGVIATSP